jgi:hypothetical protein
VYVDGDVVELVDVGVADAFVARSLIPFAQGQAVYLDNFGFIWNYVRL